MKIALELVEVPVRRAVEISRNGVWHRFAAILGDNSRHLLQHQRGAISRAEYDAAMTARTIGNHDCEGAGKFARFAAQLQIAPAGIPRQRWNPHAFDNLVGGKHRREDPGGKLGAFDTAGRPSRKP